MFELWPLLLVGGIVAATFVWNGYLSPRARRRRLLRAAPRVAIAAAQEGQVAKLAGRLELDEDSGLTAPISGRRCALWEVSVRERRGRSERTIIEERQHVAELWIVDPTGRALVQLGDEPELLITVDGHASSGTFNDASPGLEAFLERHGQRSQGWVFNRSLTYREGVLEPGEAVAVLARCGWEPDPDPRAGHGAAGYRSAARRLVLRPAGQTPMLLSDDPSTLGG